MQQQGANYFKDFEARNFDDQNFSTYKGFSGEWLSNDVLTLREVPGSTQLSLAEPSNLFCSFAGKGSYLCLEGLSAY